MSGQLAQFFEEHSSLSAVLHAMLSLVREVRERDRRVDPKIFRAILYYLDVFLEREHHRKEEAVLFPRIRQRTHEADNVSISSRANTNQARKRFASSSRRSCATKSMAQPNSRPSPKRWSDTSGITASTCARKNVK